VLKMNGTECLNLNITVPNPHREEKNGSDNQDQIVDKGLPVMVFIHGGGFIMGANSWPQYDMEKLVEKSVDMGMPIIGINIKCVFGKQEMTPRD
jgi:carboxylesterase type B